MSPILASMLIGIGAKTASSAAKNMLKDDSSNTNVQDNPDTPYDDFNKNATDGANAGGNFIADTADAVISGITDAVSAKMVASDIVCKVLKDIATSPGPFSQCTLDFVNKAMHAQISPDDDDEEGDDTTLDGDMSDDMVDEYARNLRNFLYTYKPQARQLDASIDPNEEHRGPMAQDIEKVAPDCVVESPEGYKEVDGSRLALVNAGVIGDLSRRVIELENKLKSMGV